VRTETLATSDGRVASVKRAESDADRVRLRTEASALDEIRHPNVVELLDADPDMGSIRTRFCARTTLATTPPTSMDELADVAEGLVAVVTELHQLGWAHGGLSPDHCLVANSNRIVLCSFGRARRIPGPTHPAARGDRDALRAMLAAWRAGLPAPRQRKDRDAAARLDRAVASTGASLPLFRRPPSTEDTSTAAVAPVVRPPDTADSMRGAIARAAVYGAIFLGLLLVGRPTRPVSGTRSLLTTTANWTLLIGRPLALYGFAISVICAVAVRTRRERWARVGRRLAPGPLRRIVTGVAVAGAVSTIATHIGAPGTRQGIAAVAVARTATPSSMAEATTTSTTTSNSTPATTSTTVPPLAPVAQTTIELPTQRGPERPAVAEPIRWTVGPGDHLWRIAEQTLAMSWGRRPTDAEIDPYWRALIAANRSRFADPRNPDLIFLGQQLDLPRPPSPPTAAVA
jgi:hypothetical protein